MEQELKNNIKKFRFMSDQITQDELANKLGVSRQTILAIEGGKFNPSVKLALKIAQYFNCKIEDIFYLEEIK
ncbi:MAG: helix-turn-helix transcriptional regulator [bacterium]